MPDLALLDQFAQRAAGVLDRGLRVDAVHHRVLIHPHAPFFCRLRRHFVVARKAATAAAPGASTNPATTRAISVRRSCPLSWPMLIRRFPVSTPYSAGFAGHLASR